MKLKTSLFIILNIFCLLFMSVSKADTAQPYRLLQGDTLLVSVWGEETLQLKEIRVLPDGSISFPLAGRMDVAGLTTSEVESLVSEKLKTYLPDPQVTVIVTGIEGNRVYVVGKVSKPGPVLLTSPLTVLQALSLAGLFDRFADTGNIKVLRNTAQGQKVFSVNYNTLIKGQDLGSNITILPGDTILVP